jgi:hypothetical protein
MVRRLLHLTISSGKFKGIYAWFDGVGINITSTYICGTMSSRFFRCMYTVPSKEYVHNSETPHLLETIKNVRCDVLSCSRT